MKENNNIFYVHNKSNHPPSILKNSPKNIENRLSKISANEEVFTTAIPPYQAALEASEYNHQLKFDPNARNQPTRSKNRNRKGAHGGSNPSKMIFLRGNDPRSI